MTVTEKRRRPFQLSLRSSFVAFVALGLLFVYGGTYYRLRTRGLHEAQQVGLKGFLYVPFPFEEAKQAQSMNHHYRLMIFFAPANFIDRNLFGGPYPTSGILWGLS
jgi:hypothetical protein